MFLVNDYFVHLMSGGRRGEAKHLFHYDEGPVGCCCCPGAAPAAVAAAVILIDGKKCPATNWLSNDPPRGRPRCSMKFEIYSRLLLLRSLFYSPPVCPSGGSGGGGHRLQSGPAALKLIPS